MIASYNWWGNNSGPFNENENPDGTGDTISYVEIFKPWLEFHPNNIPKVEIITIHDKRTVKGNVALNGIAWDIDGTIESVEISFDGATWIEVTGTTSWEYDWNTSEISDGRHNVMVRSWDGYDYSNSEKIQVSVDNHEDDSNLSVLFILIVLLMVVTTILLSIVFELSHTIRHKKNR